MKQVRPITWIGFSLGLLALLLLGTVHPLVCAAIGTAGFVISLIALRTSK